MGSSRASVAADTFAGLPGWELVSAGLEDVEAGRETIAAELVRSAAARLSELGLPTEPIAATGPNRLYELVVAEVGERRAHGRYNAYRRRLASFLRAARGARAR